MKNFLENSSKNSQNNSVKNPMLKYVKQGGGGHIQRRGKLNKAFSPAEHKFLTIFSFVRASLFGFTWVEFLAVITIPKKVRRTYTWITPCKRSTARGLCQPFPSELRSSSTENIVASSIIDKSIELLRSSGRKGNAAAYPELRFACTGLSIFKSYGLFNAWRPNPVESAKFFY
jgi:hypothetical protein